MCGSSSTAVVTKDEADVIAWQLEVAERDVKSHTAAASRYASLLEYAHAMIDRQNTLLHEKQDRISALELELSKHRDVIDKGGAVEECQQVAVLPALGDTIKHVDQPVVSTSEKDIELEDLHRRLAVRRQRLAQGLKHLQFDQDKKTRVLHSLAVMEESQSLRETIVDLQAELSNRWYEAIDGFIHINRIRNHLKIKQYELNHLETLWGQNNIAKELEAVKTRLEAKKAELATVNEVLLRKQLHTSNHGYLQEILNQSAEAIHMLYQKWQDQIDLGSMHLQVRVYVLTEGVFQTDYDSALEEVKGGTGAETSQSCTAQLDRDGILGKAREEMRPGGNRRSEDRSRTRAEHREDKSYTEAPGCSDGTAEMCDVDPRDRSDDEWEVLDGHSEDSS